MLSNVRINEGYESLLIKAIGYPVAIAFQYAFAVCAVLDVNVTTDDGFRRGHKRLGVDQSA